MTSTPHLGPASPRALAFVVLLATGLLAAAIFIILRASQPGTPLAERLLLALLATITLLLPARIIFVTLRRYFREGRWTPTDEERLANRARAITESPMTRIIASPLFEVALSILPEGCLAIQFRPGHKPLDGFDLALTLVYCLLIAQSAWTFLNKVRRARAA